MWNITSLGEQKMPKSKTVNKRQKRNNAGDDLSDKEDEAETEKYFVALVM